MAVALNNSLAFGGVDSADYGIYIDGGGVFNSPQRDVSMISIPGRNGDLTIDNGRFENVEVTYSAFIDGRPDGTIHDRVQAFRNAIGALRGYQRLEDTYNPDEYRQALFIGGLEVDPVVYQTGGEFEITFNCKPQRWLKSGEEAITLTPGTTETLVNPTNFDAYPVLAVTGGAGKHISFAYPNDLNIYRITIASGANIANPPLYIDCELMEAYEISAEGVITSHNADVSFESPNTGDTIYLKSQTAVVAASGITSATITPRWWRI